MTLINQIRQRLDQALRWSIAHPRVSRSVQVVAIVLVAAGGVALVSRSLRWGAICGVIFGVGSIFAALSQRRERLYQEAEQRRQAAADEWHRREIERVRLENEQAAQAICEALDYKVSQDGARALLAVLQRKGLA